MLIPLITRLSSHPSVYHPPTQRCILLLSILPLTQLHPSSQPHALTSPPINLHAPFIHPPTHTPSHLPLYTHTSQHSHCSSLTHPHHLHTPLTPLPHTNCTWASRVECRVFRRGVGWGIKGQCLVVKGLEVII